MNRSAPLAVVLLLLACVCTGAAEARPLFNGTNFAGWYTWLVDTHRAEPRQVFSISNGVVRISGDGLGYLATSNEFRDYKLSTEFKWGTNNTRWGDRIGKARDSGVFVHAIGPDGNSHDGNGAFMAAIECNIFQGATGDFLLIRGNDRDGTLIAPHVTVTVAQKRDADGWPWWKQGGVRTTIDRWGRVNWLNKSPDWKDVTDFRGPRDVEKPVGEWNRLQITCDEDRVTIVLNDIRVNEALNVFPSAGKILLQCEGSEIFFRRAELTSLHSPR